MVATRLVSDVVSLQSALGAAQNAQGAATAAAVAAASVQPLTTYFLTGYEVDLCGFLWAKVDQEKALIATVDPSGNEKQYGGLDVASLSLATLSTSALVLGGFSIQARAGYEVDLCDYIAARVDSAGRFVSGTPASNIRDFSHVNADTLDVGGAANVGSLETPQAHATALTAATLGVSGAAAFGSVSTPAGTVGALTVTGALLRGGFSASVVAGFEADLCGFASARVDSTGRQVIDKDQAADPSAGALGVSAYTAAVDAEGSTAFVRKIGDLLQVETYDARSAKRALRTSTGNNLAPVLTADRRLIYTTDRNGAPERRWQLLAGGSDLPFLANNTFAQWGDSMMAAGSGFGPELAALYPTRLSYNQGIGGQRTRQIARRMGAVATTCTVTGGVIPASGSVAVTGLDLLQASGNLTIGCVLDGVPGTLAFTASTTTYAFTRATAGDVHPVPNPANLVPTTGLGGGVAIEQLLEASNLIYPGRNDVGKGDYNAAQHVADTEAMVLAVRTYCKQVIVGGPVNGLVDLPNTFTGGTQTTHANAQVRLEQVLELNRLFAASAVIGPFYIDRMAAIKAAGYTTAYTVNGVVYDVVNENWSSDGLHAGAAGKAQEAAFASSIITARGY